MSQAEELYEEGLAAFRRGEQDRSRRLNEQALAIAEEEGDGLNQARALIGLCRVAFRDRDHEQVEALAARCRPFYLALEDRGQVTSPMHMLAESHRMHGNLDTAREIYLENIREAEERGLAKRASVERVNLALLEVAAGNYAEAEKLASKEAAGSASGADSIYATLALGTAKAGLGRKKEAKDLLDECERLLQAEGIVLDPADQPLYDQARRMLDQAM